MNILDASTPPALGRPVTGEAATAGDQDLGLGLVTEDSAPTLRRAGSVPSFLREFTLGC